MEPEPFDQWARRTVLRHTPDDLIRDAVGSIRKARSIND
jgi:hypothetical protein